mgnify:FL=1
MSNSKYNPLQPGDIVGDMFLMRAYRDVKNHRKMFSTRCTKCNRTKEERII